MENRMLTSCESFLGGGENGVKSTEKVEWGWVSSGLLQGQSQVHVIGPRGKWVWLNSGLFGKGMDASPQKAAVWF